MKQHSTFEDKRKCYLFFDDVSSEENNYLDDETKEILDKLNYSIPTFRCYDKLYKIYNEHELDHFFPIILSNTGEQYVSDILNNIFHLYDSFNVPEMHFNIKLFNYFLENKECIIPDKLMLSEIVYYSENIKEFSYFEMKKIYSLINSTYYNEDYGYGSKSEDRLNQIEEMYVGLLKKFPKEFFTQTHPLHIKKHLINSSIHDIEKFTLALNNLFYEKDSINLFNVTKGVYSDFVCQNVWNYLFEKFNPNDNCFMDNYNANLFFHFADSLSYKKNKPANILSSLTEQNQKKIYNNFSFEEIVSCFYNKTLANKFLFDSPAFLEVLNNYPNTFFDINDNEYFLKKILTNSNINTNCQNVIASIEFFTKNNQPEFAAYYGKCIFENLTKNSDTPYLWNGIPKNLQAKELEKIRKCNF